MNRDEFVQAIINQLQQQKVEDEASFTKPKAFSPQEVHAKLCFDFPLISAGDIDKLTAHLVSCFSSVPSAAAVPCIFHKKFIENCLLLALNPNFADEERTKAASSLCAVIYLLSPYYLWRCRKDVITAILFDDISESEQPDWTDICRRMQLFIIACSASLFLNTPISFLSQSRCIDAICSLFAQLNACYDHSGTAVTGDITLQQLSIAIHRTRDASIVHTTDCDAVQTTLKGIWVHLCFLLRDIMIHRPDLVPSFAPKYFDALVCSAPLAVGQFPAADHCVFALSLSDLTRSLLSSSQHFVTNRASDGQVAMRFLKSYCIEHFNSICQICEQMELGRSFNESATIISDIILFIFSFGKYCTSTEYYHFRTEASRLTNISISSRAFAVLLKLFIEGNEGHISIQAATRSRLTCAISLACQVSQDAASYILSFPGILTSLQLLSERIANSVLPEDDIVGDGILLAVSTACWPIADQNQRRFHENFLRSSLDNLKTYLELLVRRKCALSNGPLELHLSESDAVESNECTSSSAVVDHYHSPDVVTTISPVVLERLYSLINIDRLTACPVFGRQNAFQQSMTVSISQKDAVLTWANTIMDMMQQPLMARSEDRSWAQLRKFVKLLISCSEGHTPSKFE